MNGVVSQKFAGGSTAATFCHPYQLKPYRQGLWRSVFAHFSCPRRDNVVGFKASVEDDVTTVRITTDDVSMMASKVPAGSAATRVLLSLLKQFFLGWAFGEVHQTCVWREQLEQRPWERRKPFFLSAIAVLRALASRWKTPSSWAILFLYSAFWLSHSLLKLLVLSFYQNKSKPKLCTERVWRKAILCITELFSFFPSPLVSGYAIFTPFFLKCNILLCFYSQLWNGHWVCIFYCKPR